VTWYVLGQGLALDIQSEQVTRVRIRRGRGTPLEFEHGGYAGIVLLRVLEVAEQFLRKQSGWECSRC
jgi:hypothetical protein